ncbi:hypothetical protein KAH94_01875 [bacterium]|nr:hypothetical protein [bacterium]
MKKRLAITLTISFLCAIIMNMRVRGTTSSFMQRGFTRRFGANSYLLQQPSHFKKYKFNKKLCCKSLKKKTPKKRHHQSCYCK